MVTLKYSSTYLNIMGKLKFAMNGKRDIHGVEEQFDQAFNTLRTQETWAYDSNRLIVLEYLSACLKGKVKSNKKNRRISKAWLYRILGMLRLLSEKWLVKNFDEAGTQDWSNFYDEMEENKFLNDRGKPFKQSTKARIYKTVRKFAKWRYGHDLNYPEWCLDWDTREPIITRLHLTRHQVEKMIEGASSLKVKCAIQVLFDGGFRIEELGNLRWIDVQKRNEKNYYQAHVRPETSKTKKERFVSLYLATDLIDSYKNSRQNSNESDFLFPGNYRSFYETIRRLGMRVLKLKISPHILRHSSATYYANVIKTYQQFCTRYGWDLNSKTAQRYYHAIADDEIAEQTKEHEISQFKNEFERLKLEREQLQEQVSLQRQQLHHIDTQLAQHRAATEFVFRVVINLKKNGDWQGFAKAVQEEGIPPEWLHYQDRNPSPQSSYNYPSTGYPPTNDFRRGHPSR